MIRAFVDSKDGQMEMELKVDGLPFPIMNELSSLVAHIIHTVSHSEDLLKDDVKSEDAELALLQSFLFMTMDRLDCEDAGWKSVGPNGEVIEEELIDDEFEEDLF